MCAVSLHSVDCVCAVHIMHREHHPITVGVVGQACMGLFFTFSQIFQFTEYIIVVVILTVFIVLLIGRDPQRTGVYKITLVFSSDFTELNQGLWPKHLCGVYSEAHRFIGIYISV